MRGLPRFLAGTRRFILLAFFLSFLLFMVSPLLMLGIKAFGGPWGRTWLPDAWSLDAFATGSRIANIPKIVTNSVVIAGIAVVLSTLVAIPVAWALGRRAIVGRDALLTLFLLPRMIPPITFGVGMARIFYTTHLIDTHVGVALAHVALCAPYGILFLTTTFQGLDDRILEAARTCGAGPLKTFFHVVLPLITPGLLTTIIFTFAVSYNEFTLTIMTYGPHTETLPVKAYLVIGDGFLDIASAISVILLLPSLLILLTLQGWIRPERFLGGFKGT